MSLLFQGVGDRIHQREGHLAATGYQYERNSRIRPRQCELSKGQERTGGCTKSSMNMIQHDGRHW